MAQYELQYNKDTEHKHRWIADVEGVEFKLYIPSESVPEPPPPQIRVWVDTHRHEAASMQADLKATVEFVREQTETVRYAPTGDPSSWEIGEPYIPKSVLPRPWPRHLHIAVAWDVSDK